MTGKTQFEHEVDLSIERLVAEGKIAHNKEKGTIGLPKNEKYILVIAPDGTETRLPHKPEYKELQALTSGGHANTLIERTKVQYLGKRCDCIVNEEGILLRLPLNSKATALYQADWLKSYPGAPLSDAALFGVAVIFYGWRF